MVNIHRTRYIIISDDKILCHHGKAFDFKSLAHIGNSAIKSYDSEAKALNAFDKNFGWNHNEIQVLAVVEIIHNTL